MRSSLHAWCMCGAAVAPAVYRACTRSGGGSYYVSQRAPSPLSPVPQKLPPLRALCVRTCACVCVCVSGGGWPPFHLSLSRSCGARILSAATARGPPALAHSVTAVVSYERAVDSATTSTALAPHARPLTVRALSRESGARAHAEGERERREPLREFALTAAR